MISGNKIRANRANAKASSGPKTANGRARSVRNALRHGLSRPIHSNPALSKEVETLAREIAGPTTNAELLERARAIAEAQIDLRRVRNVRQQRLATALAEFFYESRADTRTKMALLKPFLTRELGRGAAASVRRNVCNQDAARTDEVGNDYVRRGEIFPRPGPL